MRLGLRRLDHYAVFMEVTDSTGFTETLKGNLALPERPTFTAQRAGNEDGRPCPGSSVTCRQLAGGITVTLLTGAPIWLKPFKFAVSFAIFASVSQSRHVPVATN